MDGEEAAEDTVPLGMLCCFYVEPASAKCFMPEVGTGAVRKTSLTQARMYGDFGFRLGLEDETAQRLV